MAGVVNSQGTVEQRFWGKVEITEPHWIWRGSKDGNGYGQMWVDGRLRPAHRIAYELFVGPISEGLELDHLCRVRDCVRPAHLEAVTRSVNVRRGLGPHMLAALNSTKTECLRGHPFDDENTYRRPDGDRGCRACMKIRARRA